MEAMIIARDTVLPKHADLTVHDAADLNAFQAAGGMQYAHPPRRPTRRIGHAQR